MHLLSAYRDDDDDDGGDVKTQSAPTAASSSTAAGAHGVGGAAAAAAAPFPRRALNAAPSVELDVRMDTFVDPTSKALYHNPTADQLWQPQQGPNELHRRETVQRNVVTGYIEPSVMSEHAFHENFHTFQTYGYAVNPSDQHVEGSAKRVAHRPLILSNNTFASAAALGTTVAGASSSSSAASAAAGAASAAAAPQVPAAAAASSSSSSGAAPASAAASGAQAQGPVIHRTKVSHALTAAVAEAAASGSHDLAELPSINSSSGRSARKQLLDAAGNERKRLARDKAFFDPSNVDGYRGSWSARYEDELPQEAPELTAEQKAQLAALDEKKAAAGGDRAERFEETTEFHGKDEVDYQGRSYLHPPADHKTVGPDYKSFIPKRWIHTWSGHHKGVQRIEFFPKSGHLLLSGSMDHTVKIWDVYKNKKCLRTYMGHSEAVRDMCFSADGSKFLTASYDKYVKVWDTETGQVVSRHTTKKIPYCVKLHPDRQNEFLVGQSNKKIVQWDMRQTEISQSYDEHLGPVNTVTFIDGNRRFVSSADDKKVFIWEYGIPVVIKHISEPDMHSMPYIALHPNGKFFCGQSQDNQILVYSAVNRFKVNKKKHFIGHKNAGFAAQISFSPDGRFVMSGDAEGRCFFWDWQTSKTYKKLKCHDQVTIGCVWHPVEPSWVATCSWDGTIKLWD